MPRYIDIVEYDTSCYFLFIKVLHWQLHLNFTALISSILFEKQHELDCQQARIDHPEWFTAEFIALTKPDPTEPPDPTSLPDRQPA